MLHLPYLWKQGKNAELLEMKNEKKQGAFSFSINMAKFEAFFWVFLSRTNCLFLNYGDFPHKRTTC